MHITLILILIGFTIWFLCWFHEQRFLKDTLRMWRSQTKLDKIIILILLIVTTIVGGSKDPSVVSLFRFIFWPYGLQSPLTQSWKNIDTAETSHTYITKTASTLEASIDTNINLLSFDWHVPNRLPPHDRQNVLGWQCWVTPIEINDTLYEDHYIAFNATASTNPAVINIEYAQTHTDGTIERHIASVITNSYPDTVPITLSSGTYDCYWFRCQVPPAFTTSPRDWHGEVLFGSPPGSGRGFDLAGTLVVDDGDNVWVGATTNIILEGVEQTFVNGINIPQNQESAP